MAEYAYLCDGKACGEICPSSLEDCDEKFKCRHTLNKDHSISLQNGKIPVFKKVTSEDGANPRIIYWEEKGEQND